MIGKLSSFTSCNGTHRWLTLVGGMWILACAGQTYNFSIYSSALKDALGYNQKQIAILGVFKDLGDAVGLLAGILSSRVPVWALVLIGGLQNLIGYGALWLVASGRVSQPPLWQICVLMLVGVNGATYFNTAGLVTCVGNFPRSRGVVVGLLKGLVGLSGAIFAQMYRALYAPDQASYLLLGAVAPFLEEEEQERKEKTNFVYAFGILSSLAAYLFAIIIAELFTPVSKRASKWLMSLMLLLLALPLLLPLSSWLQELRLQGGAGPAQVLQAEGKVAAASVEDAETSRLVTSAPQGRRGTRKAPAPRLHADWKSASAAEESRGEGGPRWAQEIEDPGAGGGGERGTGDGSGDGQSRGAGVAGMAEPVVANEGAGGDGFRDMREPGGEQEQEREWQQGYSGEEEDGEKDGAEKSYTLAEAAGQLNYWLLFGSMLCGAGSGLTAMNNLAQMGEAQGWSDMQVPVALMSIWNFAGRVSGGYLSEHLLREWALPRPLVVAGIQGLMVIGHLVYAFALPGSIYMGSLIIGVGYGTTYALMPAIASELFGLRHLGMLYNTFTCAVPIGSYVFSELIAGRIYDWEAGKGLDPSRKPLLTGPLGGDALIEIESGSAAKCFGAHCFRLTFQIMALVSVIGASINTVLAVRTRKHYVDLYGRPARRKRYASRDEEL
eukprot:jgi/Mesen1/4264/ME000022S03551